MSYEYQALPDGERSVSLSLFKAASGAVGLLLTMAAGLAASNVTRSSHMKPAKDRSPDFVPTEGAAKVSVKPGHPGGLQVLFPTLLGPSCIFAYTGLPEADDESKQAFANSATERTPAWLYGAKVSSPLAVASGNPGDILKGYLLCWSAWSFRLHQPLRAADRFRGYSASRPDSDEVRRGVVSVVRKDGSVEKAYWYYQVKYRKWKKRKIVQVHIQNFTKRGHGIGNKPNSVGKKVEVPFSIPGEEVTASLLVKCKGTFKSQLETVEEPSPYRVDPICQHYTSCGGCRWQHIEYQQQLVFKQKRIDEYFEGLVTSDVEQRPIVPCDIPWRYRNKMEFTFSSTRQGARYLGLVKEGPFRDVFNIVECHLCSTWVTQVTAAVRGWWESSAGLLAWSGRNQSGSLRTLTVREGMRTKDRMVVLCVSGHSSYVVSEQQVNNFVQAVVAVSEPEKPGALSIFLRTQYVEAGQPTYFCDTHLYGKEEMREELRVPLPEGTRTLQFAISPAAFFQPNTFQAEKLYGIALELAQVSEGDHVFDLFCGTGTLGICAAARAGQVTGVELNPDAASDAQANAKLNNCDNVDIRASSVNDELWRMRKNGIQPPDVVMVDPPRAGLDQSGIDSILAFAAPRLVYVSCNPQSQALDIRKLIEGGYELKIMQAVDQFPHTAHVEHVALLVKSS
eukprot:gb/GEZN01003028.1/.p1 GENE.gb/GEZN01003028.1/~~gb/GEZN01003028.1/.p1  ORF type:complete len:678 (-),score=70.00 gb/GEZN01003028.1/:233-2266(-)